MIRKQEAQKAALFKTRLEIRNLAEKYNIPHEESKFNVFCPGTLNPLNETSSVDLVWSFSSCQDKRDKAQQFKRALEVIDKYFIEGKDSIKIPYLELDVYGRTMFIHIAKQQPLNQSSEILKAVSSYAKDNLPLTEIPYGKSEVTVEAIYNHYINPLIKPLLNQHAQEESDLAKALQISNNNSWVNPDIVATDSLNKQYKIELREYEINMMILKASHQFIVMCDPEGQIIGEIHGFATDRNTGQAKAMSFERDSLKVWEYPLQGQPPSMPANSYGYTGLYNSNQTSKILFSSSESEVKERWNAAHEAAKVLNARNIAYNVLGGREEDLNSGNSNSVARTIINIMGFDHTNISGRLVTGQKKNLLPHMEFAGLYYDILADKELLGETESYLNFT